MPWFATADLYLHKMITKTMRHAQTQRPYDYSYRAHSNPF